MPGAEVTGTTGVVVASSTSGYAVNISGAVQPAFFPAGYIPTAGDTVTVLRVGDLLYVIGPVSTTPRPLTGTVAGAATGGTVSVTVTVGPSPISCRYVGTGPSVGDLVRLDWQSSTPWIWPSTAAVVPPPTDPTPPPPTPDPPPPPPQTGSSPFAAVDSGSWQVGGSWSFMGKRVAQYRYGSAPENRGAWFYGTGPTQLTGRTITRAQVRIPQRQRVGDYNSGATLHLYLISNTGRPTGDVTRTNGPVDIGLGPAGSGNGFVDVPAIWGQTLADHGGGIGIAGSPYIVLNGIDVDPSSGQLVLDWTR